MNYTKLLLVTPTFYPTHGGAELRFLRYLPLLNENGIKVEVLTGTPKRKKFSAPDHAAEWRNKKDGVLVSEFQIHSSRVLQYKLPEQGAAERSKVLLSKVIDFCSQTSTKPDVIQILSPLSIKVLGKLRKIKAMGVPVVFSYSIAHEFSENFVISWVQREKIRQVYKNFDCVIAASTVLKKLVRRIDPRANVEVVSNGVDINKFSPATTDHEKMQLRLNLGLPKNSTVICSVGAIHPRKGIDLLVEAWSNLVGEFDNLHLLLIGPRYDQEREELKTFRNTIETAIATSGKADFIRFVGQVENVDEYLKASDLFMFPSKKEGMPNAVLEAMAVGLPTILTPFIGLSEDLGTPDKEYLLVDRTTKSLADGIRKILKDSTMRSGLGRHAREWMKTTMDIETCAKKHANLYKSLAS